ncbi:hypothetical protein FSP39_007999 [Pinctada imbricata]|uniref:Uncharacterized protein n=1 Tax=Pinctada imbricata TaxID=66713 RepID=A0AA88YM13_PINIB|nr:hypothetical protein FSP39_007999 [Pinctada imbricata]
MEKCERFFDALKLLAETATGKEARCQRSTRISAPTFLRTLTIERDGKGRVSLRVVGIELLCYEGVDRVKGRRRKGKEEEEGMGRRGWEEGGRVGLRREGMEMEGMGKKGREERGGRKGGGRGGRKGGNGKEGGRKGERM